MNKLTPFFKETIEKRWSEFVKMEESEDYTSSEAVVFSIIRACVNGKLPAIKESLNRVDGKLAEQIEVVYPKFYITYPHATAIAGPPTIQLKKLKTSTTPNKKADQYKLSDIEVNRTSSQPPEPPPLVTGSLRDTLTRMSEQPRNLVSAILAAAKDVETRHQFQHEHEPLTDPLVKSVIVAGLLKLAHDGNLGAIFEVFDNIDGKLVDVIRILGEDVYLTSYDTIAPQGAKKVDGVYQMEADNTTSKWAISLGKKGGDDGSVQR
jgi:hypothetical protein